jgi:magnesium chelatase family protein
VGRRVLGARARQQHRGFLNARIPADALLSVCQTAPGALDLLRTSAERFHLSARACHRVMRVARTIADVAARTKIGTEEMSEALALRPEAGTRAPLARTGA